MYREIPKKIIADPSKLKEIKIIKDDFSKSFQLNWKQTAFKVIMQTAFYLSFTWFDILINDEVAETLFNFIRPVDLLRNQFEQC